MFEDRTDAGLQLAGRLQRFQGKKPLVLAIPRGGIPLGRLVADELGGDLDVVLVHKMGHPTNPEFAIGAVDEDGHTYIEDTSFKSDDWKAFIERERGNQLLEIKHRRKKYAQARPKPVIKGRTVIIVDDGSATGWTMKAAIAYVRKQHPAYLVAAFGVAPITAIAEIDAVADETYSLLVPKSFESVGQFYRDFEPVSDDEVIDLLAEE